jgi:microcystin synthetase protein McyJ
VLLEEGEAERLRFPDSSFDVVMAMESAFHFRTRESFFREAHRVLRANGRLVLTDLAASSAKLALKDRLAQRIGRSFWQIPKENLYGKDVYRRKLEACGFVAVEVQSIWGDVYPRFVEHARRRLEEKDLARRMNPLYHRMLIASLKARKKLSQTAMDYLLVRAVKPF